MDETLRASYLRPVLRPSSLDGALTRRSVLAFLRDIAPTLSGVVLDVGCGNKPYESLFTQPSVSTYVGLDVASHRYAAPDVIIGPGALPVRSGAVDHALMTEVLEHVSEPDALLREIHRTLRPGGRVLFTVPFLWPLHDVPDDHLRYTPFALEQLLRDAGFVDVELRATGGWDASLAQLLGLWVRRRPMSRLARRAFSVAAMPVVAALARVDRPPARFSESTMLTGLSGWAVRPD